MLLQYDVLQKPFSHATSLAATSVLIRSQDAVVSPYKRGTKETSQLSRFISLSIHRCRPNLSNIFLLRCLEGNLNVAVVVDGET